MEYHRVESDTRERENPKKNANIFSLLFFSWVREIFSIGSKRPLENDDLFPLLDDDKTQTSAENLQRTWSEETTKRVPGKQGSGYRLFRALVRMFPWTYHVSVISTFLLSGTCNVLQPMFLSLLLSKLMNSSAEDFWWAYIYAAGISLSCFGRVISIHSCAFRAELISVRWQSATIAICYKKVREKSKYCHER